MKTGVTLMYKHVIDTVRNDYIVDRLTGSKAWNIWEYSKKSDYFNKYGNYNSKEQAEQALKAATVAGFILYND